MHPDDIDSENASVKSKCLNTESKSVADSDSDGYDAKLCINRDTCEFRVNPDVKDV